MQRIFEAEVGVLSCLSHPNIIQILGACIDAREWAVVTGTHTHMSFRALLTIEIMPRGDLRRVLREYPGLALWRRFQFAIDVAEGLSWLTGTSDSLISSI